jgi:hypothetical protein
MSFETQLKIALYAQPLGPGTAMELLSVNKHGMADKVEPGSGRTRIPGRDEFGRYITKTVTQDAQGGLNTSTIEEDQIGTFTFLNQMFKRQGCFPVQERWYDCGRIDGPSWNYLLHYGGMGITQRTRSAGPAREAADAVVFNSYDVSWLYTVELVQHALTSLTVGEDQNINDIAVLSDLPVGCNDCFPGYTPDEIMYLAVDAFAASPGDYANVWYSVNGGGAWSITSTNPFDVNEDILEIEMVFISDTQFRVIVANDQTSNQIKYADITLGAEGTTTWSSALTVGAAAVENMKLLFFDRLYIGVDGDIYVSTDLGETVETVLKTTTETIADFARNNDGDEVWAVATGNTIMRERNKSGTFEELVGPDGGGDFTAIFVAGDGRLYAGNGQSLYVSTNSAENIGGWTQLKDFGSNMKVVKINCPGGPAANGGDSQLIRVVVDDASGGVGEVWESEDGGNKFRQVTEKTNTGYNEAYFSPIDDNLAWIVGDAGVLQKLSPKN